jgi:hypothetical protein
VARFDTLELKDKPIGNCSLLKRNKIEFEEIILNFIFYFRIWKTWNDLQSNTERKDCGCQTIYHSKDFVRI